MHACTVTITTVSLAKVSLATVSIATVSIATVSIAIVSIAIVSKAMVGVVTWGRACMHSITSSSTTLLERIITVCVSGRGWG